MDRRQIAGLLADRLSAIPHSSFADQGIGHFAIDDLLPAELARRIASAFPPRTDMTAKATIRERKAIMADMSRCDPLLGEALYAFQDRAVVDEIGRITGIATVEPDPLLYAAGLSAMRRGDYLHPHLDNSHDGARSRWRALNLLFYVSDWPEDAGGNLELWPNGVRGEPVTINSRFNRLVVMATHGESWHSVSPVTGEGERLCLSNYYFTPEPIRAADRFHVTSFRGRPGRVLEDAVLRADALARNTVRAVVPGGVAPLRHVNAG